jgi:hypothetical protein
MTLCITSSLESVAAGVRIVERRGLADQVKAALEAGDLAQANELASSLMPDFGANLVYD